MEGEPCTLRTLHPDLQVPEMLARGWLTFAPRPFTPRRACGPPGRRNVRGVNSALSTLHLGHRDPEVLSIGWLTFAPLTFHPRQPCGPSPP